MLAKQVNSFLITILIGQNYPKENLSKLIMNLKTPPFSIQDNNIRDLDNSSRSHPTLDEYITEQKLATKKAKTVHRRRDLDSLG